LTTKFPDNLSVARTDNVEFGIASNVKGIFKLICLL